jgi:hypothetical protein
VVLGWKLENRPEVAKDTKPGGGKEAVGLAKYGLGLLAAESIRSRSFVDTLSAGSSRMPPGRRLLHPFCGYVGTLPSRRRRRANATAPIIPITVDDGSGTYVTVISWNVARSAFNVPPKWNPTRLNENVDAVVSRNDDEMS